jgi:hypothetical protein
LVGLGQTVGFGFAQPTWLIGLGSIGLDQHRGLSEVVRLALRSQKPVAISLAFKDS